jgi:hypothetical protein
LERWFLAQWVIGAILLALMVLTLTNNSPALQKLIGAIKL